MKIQVKQSWITTLITSIMSLIQAFVLVARSRPALIICNGPGKDYNHDCYLSIYTWNSTKKCYIFEFSQCCLEQYHILVCISAFTIFVPTTPCVPLILLSFYTGTCVPICFAAFSLRLLGLCDPTIVFAESFCRVETLSLTGKLLYPIADKFLVLWPQLAEKHPRAEYAGVIL